MKARVGGPGATGTGGTEGGTGVDYASHTHVGAETEWARGRQKRRGVFREGWRWINTQRTENVVS